MLKISKEMQDFLEETNKANSGEGEVRGFPAYVWKTLCFNERMAMFEVGSGYSINGSYDGNIKEESNYFEIMGFLPVIGQLRKNKKAEISLRGIQVIKRSWWDHSYDFNDEGYASIGKGRISGQIGLEEDFVMGFDLKLLHEGPKIELKSYTGHIENKKIEEMLSTWYLNPV